jgi:hypothetical protein
MSGLGRGQDGHVDVVAAGSAAPTVQELDATCSVEGRGAGQVTVGEDVALSSGDHGGPGLGWATPRVMKYSLLMVSLPSVPRCRASRRPVCSGPARPAASAGGRPHLAWIRRLMPGWGR